MAALNENKLAVYFKKLHPDAKTPVRMRQGDGAYDLSCIKGGTIYHDKGITKFNTGIAVAIPEGYVGLLWCRGGLGVVDGCDVHGGVIDSNYRGEIVVGLSIQEDIVWISDLGSPDHRIKEIKDGDRVAQLIIQKSEEVDFIEVNDLETTNRGALGFGSSDNFPQ